MIMPEREAFAVLFLALFILLLTVFSWTRQRTTTPVELSLDTFSSLSDVNFPKNTASCP